MKLQTTDELLSVAHGLEASACHRYERLAADMSRIGKAEVGETFEALAQEKRQRLADLLADRSDPPTEPEIINGGEDVDERYAMTPQQALNLALRLEERNMAVYADIVAHTETAGVAAGAERLASECMDQLRQLRLSRRRINRSRTAGAYRRRIEDLVRDGQTADQAETAIGRMMTLLAARLRVIAQVADDGDSERIAKAARIVTELAPTDANVAAPEEQFAEPPHTRAIADVEIAFDGLNQIAETVGDETAMRQALDMAGGLIPVFHQLRQNQ